MAIKSPSGGGGMFWEINITPLTDIFLVLLIIFMVTTSVMVESATHVKLPRAQNTAAENKGVVLTYTANHELFVNSRAVPERDLQPALAQALSHVDGKIVIFEGDRSVMIGDMVKILEVAKAAGADQIAIAAQRPGVAQVGR
jgi:biopolymer transport protein ExbD